MLGVDVTFETMPCLYVEKTFDPTPEDLSRPCNPAPMNTTSGMYYDYQISADETEACCGPIGRDKGWFWIPVSRDNESSKDFRDLFGVVRPGDAPGGEAATALNETTTAKPASAARAMDLAIGSAVAVFAMAALLL